MPDARRRFCKECGKHTDEVGPLSWTGLCAEHSVERYISNVHQMHTRSGPNFLKWRRSMAASVGGVLVDDVIPKA